MNLSNTVRPLKTIGLLLIILWATEAKGDVRIRQLFKTDAVEVMGQVMPATLDTNTIWVSGDNARLNAGDTSSIILLGDTGKLLQLDHINKQYFIIDPAAIGESTDPQMKQIRAMMRIEVTVTPTEDKQKIGAWNCRKFIVEKQMGMMKSNTEIWTTTDVEIKTGTYQRVLNSLMAYMPNYENAMKEFSKIEGLTVKGETIAKVMGKEMRSTVELIDVNKDDAPSDAFAIPEGYKEIPMQIPGMH